MFALEESMSYYVYNESVDMRCGIHKLYDLVRTHMSSVPFLTENNVFIFFSKNRKQVKILRYENGGILMYLKRLEKGTFELPEHSDCTSFNLDYDTLHFIMQGVALKSVRFRKRFAVPGK